MPVTIKDIARETSLALSTISKYMNGGNVRAKNAKLIDEAIERLGYRPNIMAKSLRNAKSYTIGIVVPTMEDPFCAKVVEKIEQILQTYGYSCALCCYHSKQQIRENSVQFLLQKNVDAVFIFANQLIQNNELQISDTKIPLIILNRYISNIHTDYVLPDIAGGIYSAAEFLIQRHRKPALMTGTESLDDEDCTGYLRAHKDYHLEVRDQFIVHTPEHFFHLLGTADAPDSLIISDYQLYTETVSLALTRKLNIPDCFSLIACDNTKFSEIMVPPITSVSYPVEEMAEAAVRILQKRLADDYSDYPCISRLKTKLCVRESVSFADQTYASGQD